MSCHLLLQGILPTQGLNLHPLHCRWILYQWEEPFRKSPKHWYCLLFHSFHGEANFLKFLVHCHPTLHYVHTVKNQSTPRQLYSPSKLYCSTWIFPFQTLLLLIYSFSPLSLISLSNAWFPPASFILRKKTPFFIPQIPSNYVCGLWFLPFKTFI